MSDPLRGKRKYPQGDAREPVILRVRMRRGLLNRIHAIVAFDRERTQGAWNLSDGVREILLHWIERRETEIRMFHAAGPFSGDAPDVFGGDGSALHLRSG
jgi:hypothetical protein